MIKPTNKIWTIKLNWYSRAALFCLVLILLTGLMSEWIATSKPLYVNNNGNTYFPAFSKKTNYTFFDEAFGKRTYNTQSMVWKNMHHLKKIFAPIPYDAGVSDIQNGNYQPPFSINKDSSETGIFRHWLGTNLKGDDLLSGLIHGTTVSLKIGFFSILIALIIGVILGVIAGYFQNDTWRIPILSGILMLFGLVPSIFYAELFSFYICDYFELKNSPGIICSLLIDGISIGSFLILAFMIGKLIQKLLGLKKTIQVPMDTIISRFIEIFAAIPKLMLVVAMAAILDRSVNNVILIIGLSSWAGIARLVRAETLKIRNQDFITSAKALGLKHQQIIFHHILPNISGPIIISFVFGLSAAILIESGLSFLNIGVPENVITWGQLLADGKQNFNAWWMIVFPGFAILITVLSLNILAEKFKSLLDPVNKSIAKL
jgi:peptide/nickel transport system permease protein